MAQINAGVGSQGPKVFYDRQAWIRALVRLSFSFATNGSSSPVATTIKGLGVASVVRASTGLYTVTLTDNWNNLISGRVHLQLATPTKQKAQIKGTTYFNPTKNSGGLTFQIETLDTDTGSAVDVAANANNIVNCLLLVSYSSLGAAV